MEELLEHQKELTPEEPYNISLSRNMRKLTGKFLLGRRSIKGINVSYEGPNHAKMNRDDK